MKMTYKQSAWDLTDLFPSIDSPALNDSFKQLENCITEFEKFRDDLKPTITSEHFMMILREAEEITRVGYRVYGFAGLSFSADTQNQAAQALQARVQQFIAELQNRMLFFDLWWKDLDETNAKRLLETSGDFRYYLEAMRLFKPHTLSEAEEKIVNIKNVTGTEALNNLYDSITNRYTFKLEVEGVTKEIPRGNLLGIFGRGNPTRRPPLYKNWNRVKGGTAQSWGRSSRLR